MAPNISNTNPERPLFSSLLRHHTRAEAALSACPQKQFEYNSIHYIAPNINFCQLHKSLFFKHDTAPLSVFLADMSPG